MSAFAPALVALACLVPAPREAVVADFERGLAGWHTNDAPYTEHRLPQPSLVTISTERGGHGGGSCLRIHFNAGAGWANAYLDADALVEGWAAQQPDELALWVRGDGSDRQVRVGFQAWSDDLLTPLMFEAPLSLKDATWHRVVIPLAALEASVPGRRLRLPSIITFQVNGSGEIGPATVWIDDVALRNAHGAGGRYAVGPLDERVARARPARKLPRFGTWAYPGRQPGALERCLKLGIRFSSNGDTRLQQQRVFLGGIVTNCTPGRPSGSEITAGLGLGPEDMDQDAEGRRSGEGVESSVFHPAVLDRFCDYVRERVRARRDAPWVASFMLSSPISMYGEAHYAPSSAGQYAVFSRPARENFRRWLRATYRGDLSALSRAWGERITDWDAIAPPLGPRAGPEGIDTRTRWSDFMHWYSDWLDHVTWRSLQVARSETHKPLAIMLGGPKVGPGEGISLGHIGPNVRMLSRVKPAFFSDTDAQTLFSCRYSRAACSQYGVELMLEHVGPPTLEVFHQYNMLLNVLACGADHAHLATQGELFDPKHWFYHVWDGLAPVLMRYRTSHVRSDAVWFHSYVTSWYRPSRSNNDGILLYDATNSLWHAWLGTEQAAPSWGRALSAPDVVDDAMVEDGALRGRKLMVIPNCSVTLTTRKAVEAIRDWVRGGGTLIGFGAGCLGYTVESDRSVRATPGMAGMIPRGAMAAARGVAGSQPRRVEARVGRGRAILYLDSPDPQTASGLAFARKAMGLLQREADRAGVRRFCRCDAGADVNVQYAGRDARTRRHVVVLDVTRAVANGLPDAIFWTDRTIRLTFDPSLRGGADLVSVTDAFESCTGGRAEYDPVAHTLIVHFTLPGPLTLRFGKARSGLAAAKHRLLYWQGDDLVLRPSGGYGVVQTQTPVRVGADGTLDPGDVSMPWLIHGDLHRAKFGRGPTFRVALRRPGAVLVHINSVAGRAPAAIVAWVDDKEVLRRELPDRDGAQNPFGNEYDEDVAIPTPAGEHSIRIDNTGADWFSVDRYVFRGLR